MGLYAGRLAKRIEKELVLRRRTKSCLVRLIKKMRKRIYLENHCYFITVNPYKKRKIFESDRFKALYIKTIGYCRNKFAFKLVGFVIMPDHIHLLIIPPMKRTVSDIMHHIDGVFANSYNKANISSGKVIQAKFWEHVVRNQKDLEEKLDYIHNNPVRAGFVKRSEDWEYSSFRNYYLDDNSVIKIDKI